MSGETSHHEHIGPYRLLSRLGAGNGAVRRAAGPDGRDVAIRLLPPGAAPDIARMREVLSPYVVDVLDGDAAAPTPYVVSRFVPGRPLGETVAEQGPMPGDALRRLAFGLARALAAIHGAGLVHGELGPGTILVVDGAPVVIDFGLTAGVTAADDVRAWAATVTYAAAGAHAADPGPLPLDALPADLRPLVEAAAALDAGARPDAAELAEATSRLDLPSAPATRSGPTPAAAAVPAPPPARAPAAASPEAAGTAQTAAGAHGLAVARGWARLLAAMVVVIAVAVVVIAPIAGLVLSLGAVTLLRVAGTTARGWAWAFGRTLLTVPYAAAFTVAVPLGLVAVSSVGGEIDSLSAAAFGAGAGAAVLWTAPGVSGPRRQLERMFLSAARRPRHIAAAGAVLGGLALVAVVGALTLTPSFSPMYGLQSSVEGTMDRLQTAVNRF
ncbi:protein kinase domain-containing protein [Actinomadura sp. 3N407]|uniref:protein kinase domain-containing protein n=1 Tax=Actinomadura sp. 3N407 TaxID=3457423 RepID=UPI003FCC94FC